MRLLACVVVMGCSSEPLGEPAWFPPDYAATYQEMRGCRLSLEHSSYMRILVSPDAVAAFERTAPFSEGAIVLKEQHPQGDVTCGTSIEAYTVMRKLSVGASPDTLDWEWQDVGANRHERDADTTSCVACHDICGKAPMGYDGTCSEPL